jgi:hypothetical protein
MAISKNLLIQGMSGALGKQIVFRTYRGKQVVSAYPDMSDRVLSPKQLRRNEIMKMANAELRLIKADKQQLNAAQLRLNVSSNQLHHALLKELLIKFGGERME